ncbi:hypothetical protein Hanom_Chr07g00669331 [Helianthus anomalus]
MIYASGDEFCDVYELNHIRFVPFFCCFKDRDLPRVSEMEGSDSTQS